MGAQSFIVLMVIAFSVNAAEYENYKDSDDPKDLFFRSFPLEPETFYDESFVPIREKRRLEDQNFEIPQPGGLFGKSREVRAVNYHVLPSPGLHSHFQPKPKRHLVKRNAAEQPNFDLQFIQGTASNKDVISQNYAKSVVEEVTRTASIAGNLPGYDLKFIQGTASSSTVEGTTIPSVAVPTPNTKKAEATTAAPTNTVIEKTKEKPLEITILDKEDIANTSQIQQPLVTAPPKQNQTEDLSINDFIRFRRNTLHHDSASSNTDMHFIKAEARYIDNVPEESMVEEHTIPLAVRLEEDRMRLKRDQIQRERSGKMLLATGDQPIDTNREPRGATTKEQWVKQPYPVQNTKYDQQYSKINRFEDISGSSSEGIRAPRVRFVTQRRSESAPQPTYYYYEREGRSGRDFNMDLQRDREMPRDFYYRKPRYYRPRDDYPRYYDNDDEPAEGRYIRQYEDPNRQYPRRPPPVYNANKQRRIIYYATLPEVVRRPTSDVRDRYNRGRYDDRQVSSNPYDYNRKGYPVKSRYEETTRLKPAYPQKVSTDVSVSEIKKNPERKIYAEVDRRYPYKNYRQDGEIYDRRL